MHQSRKADPSGTLENRHKPGLEGLLCGFPGRAGGSGRVGRSLTATVPRQITLGGGAINSSSTRG
jgi:hypothetical protein